MKANIDTDFYLKYSTFLVIISKVSLLCRNFLGICLLLQVSENSDLTELQWDFLGTTTGPSFSVHQVGHRPNPITVAPSSELRTETGLKELFYFISFISLLN